MRTPLAPLQQTLLRDLYLYCPAVSQRVTLMFWLRTCTILLRNSTPTVAFWDSLNSLRMYLVAMLVLPVPVEPMMTILNIQQSSSMSQLPAIINLFANHQIIRIITSTLVCTNEPIMSPPAQLPSRLFYRNAPYAQISSLQQKNMSYQSASAQPTYTQPHHHKNSRLYQQLLTSNYLHDHIYHPQEHNHPASIKFASPLNNHKLLPTFATEKEDKNTHSPRYSNLLKSFESVAKTSHQATQSLGSNYSIIEMENESYSTLNLYSLSRNHIEPDLSLSSNNITEKLNHDDTVRIQEESKQSDLLLEGSSNRQAPTLQEVSCLQTQQRMKKYKSEEFGIQSNEDQLNESQQKSPLPRLLADKYIKNEINRKFSSSHASEQEQGNFRAVLNEVYVIPYKINERVQPYAFSLPVENNPPQNSASQFERRGKTNSLNLNHSRQSDNNEEETGKDHHLYFSNHNHLDKHRPQPILTTHNTPLHSEYRNSRPVPKSEPKEHHLSNEKTARSNSIGCKGKPVLSAAKLEHSSTEQSGDKLDHSRVIRLFKQEDNEQINLTPLPNQQSSVILDESEVNLCCGFSRQEKPAANRIQFSNKSGGVFCAEAPRDSTEVIANKRICSYKINPLSVIKAKSESKQSRESESQKKGIRLVGFNTSFPRKE